MSYLVLPTVQTIVITQGYGATSHCHGITVSEGASFSLSGFGLDVTRIAAGQSSHAVSLQTA